MHTRLTRRLMYRPHPKSRLNPKSEEHDLWPFLIEIQGTHGRCDWGQLVAKVWAYSGHPDKSQAPEAYARLFAAAPRMLAALQAMIANPGPKSLQQARDAIADATARSSCPACNGSTEKFPCETCHGAGMVLNGE